MSAECCISCFEKKGLVSVQEELTFDGYTCRQSCAAALIHECFNIEMSEIQVLYAMCSACLTKLLQSYSLKEQIKHNLNSLDSESKEMTVKLKTEPINVEYMSDDRHYDDIDTDDLPLSTYCRSNGTTIGDGGNKPVHVTKKNTTFNESLSMCDLWITTNKTNKISNSDHKIIASKMSLNGIVMMKNRVSKSNDDKKLFKEVKEQITKETDGLPAGKLSKTRTSKKGCLKSPTAKESYSKSSTSIESYCDSLTSVEGSSKSFTALESSSKSLTSLESSSNTLAHNENACVEYLTSGSHALSFNEKMQREFKLLRHYTSDFYMFSWYNSKYHCSLCEQKYGDVDDFKTHARQHSVEDTDFFFHSTNFNTKRKILKVDISSMKCKYCGEDVTQPEMFRNHLSLKHDIKSEDIFSIITPYNLNKTEMKCVVCCKVFFNIMMLTRHMNEHYANFICSECGTPFSTAHRLSSHRRSKHVKGVFQCKNHCDRTFETPVKRNTHMRTVKSGRWSLCPLCPEKLTNFYAKMAHLAKVHNEEIKKYKCDICPQKYVTAGALKSHVRKIHLNERNHVCPVCGDAFFSKVYLRDHMVKHNGEKIFHCEVCDKSFTRKSSLRIHRWVHKSYKRFVCQICSRCFAQNGTLKTHLKVHLKPRTRRNVEKQN